MQQHSGEHVLCAVLHNRYGVDNVGFHMGSREMTLDVNGVFEPEDLAWAEEEANRIVRDDLPITISYPSAEELETLEYRSKKEIDGPLRLVEIPGVDMCACCAPHVKRTGEIGQLMVASAARYKGGTRLHILCGGRALKAARQDADFLSETGQLLSCSKENLAPQIKAMIYRENELVRMLEESKAAELKKMVDDVPVGKKNVILSAGQINEKTSSEAADRLSQLHSGVCGVLFADGVKQRVVLVSRTIPLRAVAQALRQSTGFKGGGDDGCIRGMIDLDAEQLEKWLDEYTA
jgi:alanyl-tRNA synthetase